MSKHETWRTRQYLKTVGGLLIEEFRVVKFSKENGFRDIDGVIVLGEEHKINKGKFGTGTDYEMATSKIVGLLKDGILNETPGIFKVRNILTNDYLHDEDNRNTDIAEKWLREAQQLAEDTLKGHKKSMMKLSDLLLSRNYLRQEDIGAFAENEFPTVKVESNPTVKYAQLYTKKREELFR